MVFQYNPLETYLETTAEGALLCTINSTAVLTPKLRYNVGDEGRLHPSPRCWPRFRRPRGPRRCAAWQADRMRLPLLFLFGRRDSTISYMGANIYPQDVEYGLYTGNPLAHLVEGFCLELEEHADLESRPVVNLQLREGRRRRRASATRSWSGCRDGVVHHLASVSRDFAESLDEDPSAGDLRVRCTTTARARSPAPTHGSRTSTWSKGAAHEDRPTSRPRRHSARPGPCSSAPPGTAARGRSSC